MKNQNMMQTFKVIWKISSAKGKFYLIFLFILSLIRSITELMVPLITACIISKVQNLPYFLLGIDINANVSILTLVILTFGAFFLFSFIGSLIRSLIKKFGAKTMGNLNIFAIQNLMNNNNNKLNLTNGEISYIVKNAGESIPQFLENFLIKFFVPIISTILAIIYISTLSIVSFLIVIASMGLIFLVVYYRVSKNKQIINKLENINGKINNTLLNDLDNLDFINFNKTNSYEINIFSNLNKDYYKNEKYRTNVYLIYWALIYIIQFICSVLVIYTVMLSSNNASLASMIIVLIPYMMKIFTSTESLGYIIVELQQYIIKICRLNNLINILQEYKRKNYVAVDNLPKDIKIDSIFVRNLFVKKGNFKLNLTANFFKGKINCIIGKSGSGKTTLIRCILGLEDYSKGEIIVNNTYKINNLLNENDKIAVAFQDEIFFDRNIKENIMYPNNELDDKAKKLINYFGLKQLIKRDDIVADNNKVFKKSYSGGEKKRITLARVLRKDAQVYIFDEPTNELDEKNVQKVLKKINKLKDESIVIIVSHDNRIMQISENIINLEF